MRTTLLKLLRAPHTKVTLAIDIFESDRLLLDGEEDITEGILTAIDSGQSYPVINSVPIMLESAFNQKFLDKHVKRISLNESLFQSDLKRQVQDNWSYSTQWTYHSKANLAKTWGWTAEERVQQFFLETDTDSRNVDGKLILDAGCGNGQFSSQLTEYGATVIALDYSTSVFSAEKSRKSQHVHFLQADLTMPPFDANTFDIVIASGVIHRTPSPYKTFVGVADLVKPGGRLYLWVSRRPESFLRRQFFYPGIDLMRRGVARLPRGPQLVMVNLYALILITLQAILGTSKKRAWGENVVAAYNTLTPLWHHYHTPLEISYWFFANGYSSPTLTHWDNPYGFGMVATKRPQKDTPGVNFGKRQSVRRYWR